MIFFDDDPQNIRDVGSLGVLSVLTPKGVTRDVWEKGLADFSAARK
jgi:magnesium-dependent phosphatase 1